MFVGLIQRGNLLKTFQISLGLAESSFKAQCKPLGVVRERLQMRDQHQTTNERTHCMRVLLPSTRVQNDADLHLG